MIDPTNDADMEMLELEEAGRQAAAGVCSLCDDVLDPMHPKWRGTVWYHDTTITAEMAAAMLGPVHTQLPWHVECMKDNGIEV